MQAPEYFTEQGAMEAYVRGRSLNPGNPEECLRRALEAALQVYSVVLFRQWVESCFSRGFEDPEKVLMRQVTVQAERHDLSAAAAFWAIEAVRNWQASIRCSEQVSGTGGQYLWNAMVCAAEAYSISGHLMGPH